MDVKATRTEHQQRLATLVEQHQARFFAAQDAFDEDPKECLRQAEALLKERELSPELRIRTLMIAADATDDWNEGNRYLRDAKSYYMNTHSLYPTGSDPAVIAVLDEIGKDLTDLTRIVLVKMPSGSDGEDKEDSGSQEEMEGDAEVEFEHRFEEEAEGGANPSSSISPVSIITPTDPSPLPASTYDRDTNRTAGGVADMTDREYFEWIKAKLPVEEQEEFQRRTEDQQEFQRRIEDQQEFQRRIDSLLSRAA